MLQLQNKNGFSIVFALGLVLLLSFIGLYLLEYMIPFSRNIKWVENSSIAFYESYSGIESALYWVSQNPVGYTDTDATSWYSYGVVGEWTNIPARWNSQYDTSRNRLSMEDPIQIIVWNDLLDGWGTDAIHLLVRIPDLDNINSNDETFNSAISDDIILWQLSSDDSSLTVETLITEWDINIDKIKHSQEYKFWDKWGLPLSGSRERFSTFYARECVLDECILKITVINPLISSTTNTPIPYLEYSIVSDQTIPLQSSQISSTGNSNGFQKTLNVTVPQQVTNAAFDFTVFQ